MPLRARLPISLRQLRSARGTRPTLSASHPTPTATQIAPSSSQSEVRYEAAAALATPPSPPANEYNDHHEASSSSSSRLRPTHTKPPLPPLLSSTPSRADDDSLKAHFDNPDYSASTNNNFMTSFTNRFQSHEAGLFLYPPLTSPSSLPRLTDRTLIHARHIVDRINNSISDPTGKELRLVVKNLDRLSDLLCGVIDMCELIRNVHPDESWIMESERTYERLCSFMNELNTDTKLYEVSWASRFLANSFHEGLGHCRR
jgi:hypothetical protein